jgi:F-type H+-transporting ATPase subunit epsilon
MAKTLRLEIVTPEAKTYSEDVDMVNLPGLEGDMGIFPEHVPLMTQISSGEIGVFKNGEQQFIAVGEGFVEVTGEKVAVLTDMAVKESDIDEQAAEEARKRAEARLQEKLSDEELASTSAALAHSLAQLKVKRRNRH